MCSSLTRPERNVCIWEGWAKWISERETIEEKLVAYETIMAIAFPEDDTMPYRPPKKPEDGSKLSRCDLIRRDVYHQWHGIIENRSSRNGMKIKDPRKVAGGRIGAQKRWGNKAGGSSECSDCIDENNNLVLLGDEYDETEYTAAEEKPSKKTAKNDSLTKGTSIVEEQTRALKQGAENMPIDEEVENIQPYSSRGRNKYRANLSKEDKEQIAFWRNLIPSPAALHDWIDKNFFMQNKKIALSDGFCNFAFAILDRESNWCSSRDHKPFKGIQTAIHWLCVKYIQQTHEVERNAQRIAAEDRKAQFDMKLNEISMLDPTEIADRERKKRKAAEKEAMEKIMRGEVLGDA